MRKAISFLLLLLLASFVPAGATASPTPMPLASRTDEMQIWDLEKAYWEYVKANDLEKYRALWHESFLGWPYSSSSPARKDHITDWITANTVKGVKLQSYDLEQVAIQITGNIAADHYRVKMTWSGPESTDIKTETLRIHHTWIRAGETWQILAGMSAPVNGDGK
jgi:Domain of unknown function (DUF4440)